MKKMKKLVVCILLALAAGFVFAEEAQKVTEKTETSKKIDFSTMPMYVTGGLGDNECWASLFTITSSFVTSFDFGIKPFANKTLALEAGFDIVFESLNKDVTYFSAFIMDFIFMKEFVVSNPKFTPYIGGGVSIPFMSITYPQYDKSEVKENESGFNLIGVGGLNYMINDKFSVGGKIEFAFLAIVMANFQAVVRYNIR